MIIYKYVVHDVRLQPVEKPQQANFLDFIFNNAPR